MKNISYWLASALLMSHDDHKECGNLPLRGNILECLAVCLGWRLATGGYEPLWCIVCPRVYWQYVSSGDSFLPSSGSYPFPISSVRYCWQLLPWEMKNDTVNKKCIDLCLQRGYWRYISGTARVDLTTEARIKNLVCKCTRMIVGMVQVRPSVILVGRAGLTARLFIARWAWPQFSHNTQPTNMSKFVNTLTPIYIRAWPVYTKLH